MFVGSDPDSLVRIGLVPDDFRMPSRRAQFDRLCGQPPIISFVPSISRTDDPQATSDLDIRSRPFCIAVMIAWARLPAPNLL